MVARDLPRLFPWGRDGIPPEIEAVIRGEEINARLDRGEPMPEGPRPVEFAALGVEIVAERTREHLWATRDSPKPVDWPKVPHEIRTWCAALHAYCAKWARPAPPALMRLTFDVLGIRQGQPSDEVLEEIGAPVGVDNFDQFLAAALLDGEADARGDPLSASALARATGASRTTLRRWRRLPQYVRRRAFIAWQTKNSSEIWGLRRKGGRAET